MKKNIIMLLIFSILAMQFPAVMVSAADTDAREVAAMDMRFLSKTSINEAKLYNNSLSEAKARGMASSGGKSIAWTDINYSSIEKGKDWAGFSLEYKDSAKNLSAYKEEAQVFYTVNTADNVDVNNLYLTAHSSNGAIAGIAATSLLNAATAASNGYKTIKIALKDFTDTNAVNFVDGQKFDLTKFSGLGVVRKNAAEAAASEGRINFMQMSVIAIPTVTDVAAEVKSGIRISFTKPTFDTVDKYEIVRTDGTNEVTKTLTDDDLILDNGKYIYVDTTAEAETEYSYKVRIHDSEYDMYSPYSAAVTEEIGEEDGGTELPSDGASTIYWDVDVRNVGGWVTGNPDYKGGSGTTTVNASSVEGMGNAGWIMRYDVNPNKFKEYSTYEEPGKWQQKVYRGYMTAGAATLEAKGGDNGNLACSFNVDSVKNTGYAIWLINIDPEVPLDNLYFSIADAGAGTGQPHNDSSNYLCVPVTDYITDADKGKTMYVAIPLTDFVSTNPHLFQNIWNDVWDNANDVTTVAEMNWKRIRKLGFVRRVRNGNNNESDPLFETPEYTSGYIYHGDGFITNLTAPTEFKVYDVKENKVILKWEHTADAAVKYNVYRTEGEGERALLAEVTKDQYVDNSTLTPGVEYTYEIEAVDKYGTKSPTQKDSTIIRTVDHPRKFKAATLESATNELAVNISWEPALFGDVKEYRLYKNGELCETFAPDETSFTDKDLVEHSEYTYTMDAVDTNDSTSIQTNPITVTASCLAQPTELVYDIKNVNNVELSWSAPSFAEKYYIYLNGTQVADTEETTFTVNDVDYDTALTFGVRAVNAAGSTSNEVKTEEFVIKNPKLSSSIVIFDDELNKDLQRQPMAGVELLETKAKSIIGDKALSFDFTTRKASTVTGSLAGKIDIEDYRNNGAHLGMWIWADNNTDLSKLEIGVSMSGSVGGSTVTAYATVKASDYISKTGAWVFADIPLQELPDQCKATANGITQTSAMNYTKVTGYVVRYNNSQQERGPVVYVDQMTIDTGAQWNVSDIRDNEGTKIESTVEADATAINVTFTEDMDPESFTTSGVTLSYKDGEETKYVNFYGLYNADSKTYTLNLLEGLNPSTEYTLNMSGVTSGLGMGGAYSKTFTTGSGSSATVNFTVPEIATVMSSSTNGSVTTVSISMPEGREESVKGYSFEITYNSDVVALNGDFAIKTVPTAANVVKSAGKITVTGTRDGHTMAGKLFEIEFSPVATGTANVAVTGSVDVYNASADKTAPAKVSGSTTFATTSYQPTGGGSGSGSGGNKPSGGTSGSTGGGNANNAADRVNGATTVPNPGIEGSDGFTSNAGNADNFSDIANVEWAKDAILHLAKKGYINGFDDGTYRPNEVITREQFAKMIVMVLGYDSYTYDEPTTFTDVAADAWYENYVRIASKSGLMNGIDDNLFGVGMPITRQDMCTIIYRAIKTDNIKVTELYSDIQFEDTASDYAQEAIRQLFRYGMVNGVGNNRFDPMGEVTRAMAAKVLYQLDLLL